MRHPSLPRAVLLSLLSPPCPQAHTYSALSLRDSPVSWEKPHWESGRSEHKPRLCHQGVAATSASPVFSILPSAHGLTTAISRGCGDD